MRGFLLTILCLCISVSVAYGQKRVVVSASQPYVEWLGGTPDVDSHDMCLRISFADSTGMLKVSLSSANSRLFAFHSGGLVYKEIFGCCRRLKPERLPYKIAYDPSNKFFMTGHSRKTLGPGFKEAILHSWIESSGATPVSEEYTMPEDSLVQLFRIESASKETDMMIRLRDIFFIEHHASSPVAMKRHYLASHKDLKTEYDVTVLRDPCFGEGDRIAAVKARHKEASAAINGLEKTYPEGKVLSLEDFEDFQNTKNSLLQNYTKMDSVTDCPCLKDAIAAYNVCIDSLLNMCCTISDDKRMEIVQNLGLDLQRIDAGWLYHCARQIDELTGQWCLEKSKSAKLSIVKQCEKLIDEAGKSTIRHGVLNDDDRKALNSFIQAKEYFYHTCR
ncbi:MAG: hypothetical protein MJY69_07515 [Bacteroidales bacterium]|nr:hypothetical protein [Bacteroidales bacterium]